LVLGRNREHSVVDIPSSELMHPSRCIADPLVHHGRHFGRTLHAMANVQVLLTNGILRVGELADQPDEAFTAE
jgi:hypothetical protein